MSDEGAAVKASGVNGLLTVARSQLAPDRFARMVERFSPAARAVVEHPPMPMVWIPLATAMEIEDGLAVAFDHDPERISDLARRQIQADFNTLYRAFVRFATPHQVAARSAAIYDTYARGTGRMSVGASGEGFVELVIDGLPSGRSPAFFELRRGNVLGVLELTRVKDVRVVAVEGGHGHTRVKFRATWR